MSKNTKLELTWIGKESRPKLEPRILIEDPDKSYHAARRVTDSDIFDNRLIHGDNLLALKALEQEFTGKIKCIFIDPPYNTGAAFEQYEDGLEHSLWLTLMRDRLEILSRLLTPDGSLWATLDDNEAHYFKVLGDEVFGRSCFIADVSWQKRDGPPNDRKIGSIHDHLLVWGKSRIASSKKTLAEEAFNLMPRTEKADAQYKVFPEPTGPDVRGPFRKIDTTANGKGGRFVESLFYGIKNPFTEEEVFPRAGTCWRHSKIDMERLQAEGRLYWGVNGTARTPMRKLFKDDAKAGMTAPSIWTDVGLNQHAASELEALFGQKAAFETPKPEALLARIIHIASNRGDWILDSFAGSGTTGAVAHKTRRRWIMIEIGQHCESTTLPRLRKVVEGTDTGGVSESSGWSGGGGFRYYRLAPSLLERDQWDNWVISKQFNPAMLAEAVCKLEGFTYAPSQDHYWEHGYSTERDFIYVTTQKLTNQQLHALSEEVGSDRSLLVCCAAFRGSADQWTNLTVKKIPKAVMNRCEWGRDDYSLSISKLPAAEALHADDDADSTPTKKKAAPKKTKVAGQTDLFGGEGEQA